MTIVECLAWSAVAVSAVAACSWIVSRLLRSCGVSLGSAPALAVLASIPLVTVASLLPSFPTPALATNHVAPVNEAGPTGELKWTGVEPLLTEEQLHQPIRSDDRSPQAGAAPAVWSWPAMRSWMEPAFRAAAPWLVGLMLAGLAAGLLRLAIGWWAVRRLANSSRPIVDREFREFVDVLCAEMSCRAAVDWREVADLASPATLGWNRPIVLLPTDWRAWSEDERRAVLAHELAHVKRHDYRAWLIAQACAAVHYFNPLVRGASHWLRMEQECSADADAAALAGGRQRYLRVLANLAVRQRDVSSGWPARCFLPTRGSFVRRIEMLRSHPPRWSVRTVVGKALLASCVAAVGLSLAALRPAFASAAPTAAAVDGAFPIPQTAIAAGQIRVAEVLADKRFGPAFRKIMERPMRDFATVGLKLEDVERFGIIVLATDDVPDFDGAVVAVLKSAWDKSQTPKSADGPAWREEGGFAILGAENDIRAILFDAKTLILTERPKSGVKLLRALAGPRHDRLEKMLGKSPGSWVRFATSGTEFFGAMTSRPNPGSEMLANLTKPLLDRQQQAMVSLNVDADLTATVEAEYADAEQAQNAGKTVEALLTLSANSLPSAGPARDDKSGVGATIKLAQKALRSAKTKVDGVNVSVTASAASDEVVALLGSALIQAQANNSRVVSQNNMKQIGLAMHNYADVNKNLPAAAATEGAGKFPVSWRVRILPYIEQDALYRQYKMDEPWDSPNNRKLLDKMPITYRSPTAPSKTNTPYQVLVGDNTMFPKDRGVGFADIVDGTSNTIMVVESATSVPWTKPEDLAVPLAEGARIQGPTPDGVNVLFGDGSVRFLSRTLDAKMLQSMYTRNGGEVIDEGGPRPVPTPQRP